MFSEDQNYNIPECAINLEWCHILPTMKKGQLIKISHKMPPNSTNNSFLNNFEGLRKYWKIQVKQCLKLFSVGFKIYSFLVFQNMTMKIYATVKRYFFMTLNLFKYEYNIVLCVLFVLNLTRTFWYFLNYILYHLSSLYQTMYDNFKGVKI